jgi:hypothetical protein
MNLKIVRFKPMQDELEVSERTLYTLIEHGMPCIQVNRIIWFDREKVYKWLSQFERRGKRKKVTEGAVANG